MLTIGDQDLNPGYLGCEPSPLTLSNPFISFTLSMILT